MKEYEKPFNGIDLSYIYKYIRKTWVNLSLNVLLEAPFYFSQFSRLHAVFVYHFIFSLYSDIKWWLMKRRKNILTFLLLAVKMYRFFMRYGNNPTCLITLCRWYVLWISWLVMPEAHIFSLFFLVGLI